MKYHITTVLLSVLASFILLAVLGIMKEKEQQFCEVKFEESSATLPCAELNARVYSVRF